VSIGANCQDKKLANVLINRHGINFSLRVIFKIIASVKIENFKFMMTKKTIGWVMALSPVIKINLSIKVNFDLIDFKNKK
jgi:hypothetical protein